MKNIFWLCFIALSMASCKDAGTAVPPSDMAEAETSGQEADLTVAAPDIQITPISHATFIMNWNDQIIYVDPVGGASVFQNMPAAEIILVTDIHGDHMNAETLAAVKNDTNFLFAPKAVAEQLKIDLKPTVIMNEDEIATRNGLKIKAVPMYNISDGRQDFHPKGRGNGYVLEKDGYRIYISGDTEGVPEMRNLKNIDKAFICMNLPYTMDVEQAADAVLEFAPDEVIPYHYRGKEKFSEVEKFKTLINEKNPDIKVTLLNWYPSNSK